MLTLDEIPFGEEAKDTGAFTEGNQKDLKAWSEEIARRAKLVSHTIEPLVEISLIKLLSSSSDFEKYKSTISVDADFNFVVDLIYKVPKWYVPGAKVEAITKDAKAVFSNLQNVKDVKKWSKCEINVEKGTLEVEFTI